MYPRNDKRRIYQVISMYLSNQITATSFCDEFYYCYDRSLDHSTLTPIELYYFDELSRVCSRFSPYEEDHKKAPNAYTTENEVYDKIVETTTKLF